MSCTGDKARSQPADPGDEPGRRWHALSVVETLAALRADAAQGFSAAQVVRGLERFGPNALPEPKQLSRIAVFLRQFKSPLIYLLFAAAGVALALGHRSDAVVIFVVVTLNAVIGAFQEGRAERSLQALRKLVRNRARVIRNGGQCVVDASEIVPGDLLVLDAGDAVAADARLVEGAALQVAEAALTGESLPVAKDTGPVPADTPLADRHSLVFAGTHVTGGRARAIVVATGLRTEIGRIATLAKAAKQPRTPLERRVAQFGRALIFVAVPLFVLIVGIGLAQGIAFEEILMVGISQLVGVIPEGLPVAMTIALAVGVQRMARRKASVRRLSAVETLGSTTIICSDKTGTLTRNEMTVTDIHLPDARSFTVTGVGYAPEGRILEQERELDSPRDAALRELLEAIVLCNDAQLHGPREIEPRWKPIGDPTEVALITLALKGGLEPSQVRERAPRRAELPFDPAAKLMATQHQDARGPRVIVKGAPEVVLALCHAVRRGAADEVLDESARRALSRVADAMGERALRVLAVGCIEGAELDAGGFDSLCGRVSLLGLLGQIDPPRLEVKQALDRCREAGIKPVVVTGDHKATSLAIARTLGIARDGDVALDGRELEQLSDAELAARIDSISVFARVHPAQKLRIVGAYQSRKHVVAMTGDGVNDAPALVKADVGVAMGITGTDVAKEAAKIVITDDNFASIVAAVEEGRVVYRNIKKAVLLLFSTSAAEVTVLFLGILLGYPPPFAAVQILWNNLVIEGLVTVNLVMEAPEGDEMKHKPIPPDEPLVDRALLMRMALMTPAIVILTFGWFVLRTAARVPEVQVRTETFTLLAVCDWFAVLNCRSEWRSGLMWSLFRNRWLVGGLVLGNLLQIAVVYFRPLGTLFHTVPLDLEIVIALGAVGSLVLWSEELRKWIVRKRRRASGCSGPDIAEPGRR
jgi:magnesium-transporting ATPase (P-type)